MSWTAMRWAIEQAPVLKTAAGRRNATAAHVLAVLAYHADSEGLAWPSVERVALETGLGDSTVRAALTALSTAGLIERVESDGEARWRLCVGAQRSLPLDREVQEAIGRRRSGAAGRQARRRAALVPVTPADSVTVTPGNDVTEVDVTPAASVMSRQLTSDVTPGASVTYIRNEPKDELQDEPAAPRARRESTRQPDETILKFDAFWSAYPKRGGKTMGKDDARKAWVAAVKAIRKPDGDGKTWTVEQVIAGARRYARECEGLHDRSYVKTPGPWLRAGSWKYDDGVEAAGDPREFVNDCWRRGSVVEIHKVYDSGYFQPPAGDGDYVEDVLRPYNRRWITEHKDQILARLTATTLEGS